MAIPQKGLTLPELGVADVFTPLSLARVFRGASAVLEREGRSALSGGVLGAGHTMLTAAQRLQDVAFELETPDAVNAIHYLWARDAIQALQTLAGRITWKDGVLTSYVEALCDVIPERMNCRGVIRITPLECLVLRSLADSPSHSVDSTSKLTALTSTIATSLGARPPRASELAAEFSAMHPSWIEREKGGRSIEWRILPRGMEIISGAIEIDVSDGDGEESGSDLSSLLSPPAHPEPYTDLNESERLDAMLSDVIRECGARRSQSMTRLYAALRKPKAVSQQFLVRVIDLAYARCAADAQSYCPGRIGSLWRRMRWLSENRLIELFDTVRLTPTFDDRRCGDIVRHPAATPRLWRHVLTFPVSLDTVSMIMRGAVYGDLAEFAEELSHSLVDLPIVA